MIDTLEQAAAEAGLDDPTGVILLYGDQNQRGLVRGWMQHGEHAGAIAVDLSKLDAGEAILRSRKHRDMVVFTSKFYEAARHFVGLFRDHFPQQTMLELSSMLGSEEEADRFLEQMGLLEDRVPHA